MAQDSKFAHLIEPLKHLTAHWDVDVSGVLEEYMTALTVLDADENVNFAEAALLVSGSAAAYVRKVSDLYDWTFRVLEMITTQSHNLKTQKRLSGAKKQSLEPGLEAEDKPFLMLDQWVEEGRDLDLPADGSVNSLRNADPDSQGGALLLNALLRSDAGDSSFAITTARLGNGGALYLNGLEPASFRRLMPAEQENRVHFADEQTNFVENLHGVHDDIDGIGLSQTQPALEDDFYEDNGAIDDGPMDDDDDRYGDREGDDETDDEEEDEEADLAVWETMDPFEQSDAKPVPFRRGKTIMIPERGNDEEASVGKRMREETMRWLCHKLGAPDPMMAPKESKDNITLQQVKRNMSRIPKYLKPLIDKRNASLRKAAMKSSDSNDDGLEAPVNGASAENTHAGLVDDDSDGHPDDFGGDAEYYDGPELEFDGEFDELRMRSDTGMDLDTMDGAFGGELIAAPQTFEQLVQQHLTKFIANAARYASETQLSKRVDAWHTRLSVSLEIEEARPSFDIHNYGDACVNKVQHLIEQADDLDTSFTAVVAGAPRYECARMFLATLQLANIGRIQIPTDANAMVIQLPDGSIPTPRKLIEAHRKAIVDDSPSKGAIVSYA